MATLDLSHIPFSRASSTKGQAVFRPAETSDVDSHSDLEDRVKPAAREGRRRARRAAPVIPDMRFEQSFLLSVRPFLHPRPKAAEKVPDIAETLMEKPGGGEALVASADRDEVFHWGRELDVDWKMLFWVTARDQLFSPLAQGFLWGVLGLSYSALTLSARSSLFRGRPVANSGTSALGRSGGQATSLGTTVGSNGDVVSEWWERLTAPFRRLAI